MKLQLKPLARQVVVVTGASSGIGLATAQSAAAKGAKVVMAARSVQVLQAAADDIAAKGGDVIAVEADVAHVEEVRRVADAANDRFGRIDTWVNNAGVALVGMLEESTEDDMRRLFDTNFWGCVHGSLIALPYLEAQGGALINVGSMLSDRAVPLQGIYSASKHAIKGFTDALRMELAHRNAPVSVTLVKPASVGSPIVQHLKNDTGREAKLPPPIYAPEDVAATILKAAVAPRRDAYVGSFAPLGVLASRLMPGLADWISARLLVDAQMGRPSVPREDNLHRAFALGRVRGDHGGSTIRRSLYTRAHLHPGIAAVAAGAAFVGIAAIASRRLKAARRSD